MFTGIIEELGEITDLVRDQDNLHITVKSQLSKELKIDQSLAHNGVCLTVVKLGDHTHTVTAIQETIDKSNIGNLRVGSKVNLERAMTDSRNTGYPRPQFRLLPGLLFSGIPRGSLPARRIRQAHCTFPP